MKNNLAQATSASISSKPASILKNKKETLKDTSTTQTTLRDSFVTELHVIEHATYWELSFDIEGSSKPFQALTILRIRIINKA